MEEKRDPEKKKMGQSRRIIIGESGSSDMGERVDQEDQTTRLRLHGSGINLALQAVTWQAKRPQKANGQEIRQEAKGAAQAWYSSSPAVLRAKVTASSKSPARALERAIGPGSAVSKNKTRGKSAEFTGLRTRIHGSE